MMSILQNEKLKQIPTFYLSSKKVKVDLLYDINISTY